VVLISFTYRELGTPPVSWYQLRLADTRTGTVVAAVTAPLDSLGASPEAQARAVLDSLLVRRSPHRQN